MAEQGEDDDKTKAECGVVPIKADGNHSGRNEDNSRCSNHKSRDSSLSTSHRRTADEYRRENRKQVTLAHRRVIGRVEKDLYRCGYRTADSDQHKAVDLHALDVYTHCTADIRIVTCDMDMDSKAMTMEDETKDDRNSNSPEELCWNWTP